MVLSRKVPILPNSNWKDKQLSFRGCATYVKISKQHSPCVLRRFNMFRELEKDVAQEPKKDLQS